MPVLEPAEHSLDEVSLFVEFGVVVDGLLAVFAARDARRDVAFAQRLAEPIAVVAPVGDQDVGIRQCGQDGRSPAIVADLAFGQQQYQGLAVGVAHCMQFRVQAALGAPDSSRRAYPVVTHTHYMYGVASSGSGGGRSGMDVLQRDDLSFPRSLPEFQRLFPDDTACAAYLEKARWGERYEGFRVGWVTKFGEGI